MSKRKSSKISTREGTKRARTGDGQTCDFDDPIVGRIQAHIPSVQAQEWIDISDGEHRFARIAWQDEACTSIVYTVRQRGDEVLVVCCRMDTAEAESGFGNQLYFQPEEVHVIDKSFLDSPVEVKIRPFKDLHVDADNVGDGCFVLNPSEVPQCCAKNCEKKSLGSNAAYVVCSNETCAKAYHAACMSATALAYRGQEVYDVDSNESLSCPGCAHKFGRCMEPATSTMSATILVDMGTTRTKASITGPDREPRYLLDDPGAPEPKVLIVGDESKHSIFFTNRAMEGHKIQPIKEIVCGFAEIPFSISPTEILKRYFLDMIVALRQKLPKSEDCTDILFAVAVPAGLDLDLQNQMLDAILQSGTELTLRITPVILNEAKMGYFDSSDESAAARGPDRFALAVDLGGFTTDLTVMSVSPRSSYTDVTVRHAATAKYGNAWIKRGLVARIHALPNDPINTITLHVDDYFNDKFMKKEPATLYKEIPIDDMLHEIQQEQSDELRDKIKNVLSSYSHCISELVLTGRGADNLDVPAFIAQHAHSALVADTQPKVVKCGASETSSVLKGMHKYLRDRQFRQNKLTVVIKSNPNSSTERELIVLQKKGEAIEDPVVPASRKGCTIFYDIKRGSDDISQLQLEASTADIQLAVSSHHYQVASDPSQFHYLGSLNIDLNDAAGLDFEYCAEVVQVKPHEAHNTVTAEAIIMVPKEHAESDWTTWGLNENMSIEAIVELTKTPDCEFTIVATMGKKSYSIDYEAFVTKHEEDVPKEG